MQSVRNMLLNLDLNYLDLVLIHYPFGLRPNSKDSSDPFPRDQEGKLAFSDVDYMETYRALEECVDRGQVKSIGLSNFDIFQCQNVIVKCRIKPVCNQIEVHPYFQNKNLVEFCQSNGVLVVGYSTLGANDLCVGDESMPRLLEDKELIRIGVKNNKSAAQVCLRWSFQRGCIPLVKSMVHEHILENAQVRCLIFNLFIN